MPSASRRAQLAVLCLCGTFAAGGLAGCETTQEKAAAHRAKAERILEAREQRPQKKQEGKHEKEKQ